MRSGLDGARGQAGRDATLEDQYEQDDRPVTTGSVGDIGNLDNGVTSQVSTGIGNIQQGVSATAISF